MFSYRLTETSPSRHIVRRRWTRPLIIISDSNVIIYCYYYYVTQTERPKPGGREWTVHDAIAILIAI